MKIHVWLGHRASKCLIASCWGKQVFVRFTVVLLINLCWVWHCIHLGLEGIECRQKWFVFCKLFAVYIAI